MKASVAQNLLKVFFYEIQEFSSLAGRAGWRMFRKPFYHREFVIQLDKIGVDSLFIILLTGVFTGMVMALQALIQLKPFAATSYVGGMVAVTMVKELGPVLSALMISGRVGSAITAELGTMVVTEQVDAMRVMATVVAMPLLAIITDTVALGGGYVIASGYDINPVMYWNSLPHFMVFQDLIEGIVKPAVFGLIISLIGCYVGLNTSGGAEGVGAAAKRTVVLASSLVLVSDFFLTKIFIVFR